MSRKKFGENWDHQAAGSNPVTPTIEKAVDFYRRPFAMLVFMRV